jgi:hypothetical protein
MKQKKDSPIKLTDESSQVERSIELSSLIWVGFEEVILLNEQSLTRASSNIAGIHLQFHK